MEQACSSDFSPTDRRVSKFSQRVDDGKDPIRCVEPLFTQQDVRHFVEHLEIDTGRLLFGQCRQPCISNGALRRVSSIVEIEKDVGVYEHLSICHCAPLWWPSDLSRRFEAWVRKETAPTPPGVSAGLFRGAAREL